MIHGAGEKWRHDRERRARRDRDWERHKERMSLVWWALIGATGGFALFVVEVLR